MSEERQRKNQISALIYLVSGGVQKFGFDKRYSTPIKCQHFMQHLEITTIYYLTKQLQILNLLSYMQFQPILTLFFDFVIRYTKVFQAKTRCQTNKAEYMTDKSILSKATLSKLIVRQLSVSEKSLQLYDFLLRFCRKNCYLHNSNQMIKMHSTSQMHRFQIQFIIHILKMFYNQKYVNIS